MLICSSRDGYVALLHPSDHVDPLMTKLMRSVSFYHHSSFSQNDLPLNQQALTTQSLSGSPLVLKSALASRHQKRSSRRVSFQPVDKSHAWNSNDDSRASSTTGCSSVQEDSCETKTSSSHWKSRMPDPLRGRFIPFKSQRSPSQSLLASNLKLRRSKRVRAPTVCDPHIRVVHDFVLASDGYPYSTPIGVQVEPTDDDIRRYQRAQKRLKLIDEARDNSGLRKRLRQRRTQRLQALARLYRRSADRELLDWSLKLYFCFLRIVLIAMAAMLRLGVGCWEL
ncbi:hypothetical protein D915_010684 [Fasciola hepatica]|uniref:Uncharacterized protein n=1 Tax=Fasciola hepatica TaxID=6192 RepID=A0A4E0QY27_FASHE|nr:hypothetical protein D915_010684 [Fasciola hepatica]